MVILAESRGRMPTETEKCSAQLCSCLRAQTHTHTHAKAKQNAQMYAKTQKIQLKSIHKYTKDTHTLSNWACVCINVL